MSVSAHSGIMRTMTALTALALLAALALGGVVGWLLHAARSGDRAARAEAQLAALRENEGQLRQALAAIPGARA